MNKTAIKNFAIWAREKIIADILYKAKMVGITSESIAEKLPQSTIDLHFYDIGTKDYAQISGREISQRSALVNAIREKEKNIGNYKEAFQYVIEEVAYTWFNRLIAIRFMEVNDYLPSGVRVLSSENNAKKEPDLVTNPFDTDIDFTIDEQDEILRLKDKNSFDELFRILFIKQCNKLHDILPELFEKTNDYTELLLTISYTDKDSIVYRLVHDIDENDFNIEKEGQVEIIGWMYQYYISKKHDEIVNIYKGIVKKEDIPATTQLFTTDWVVRYMVDNSLGRYWIERNPQSKLAEKLKFLVIPKNGEIVSIDEKINPTDITFFDPCMGSGHILVYAFDVFMEIYRECGYSDRDASLSILENNIFGMDIDKRAYQLAYFAVIMKARSYNRRILTKVISKNLTFIEESNSIDKVLYKSITKNEEYNRIGDYLVQIYKDAKEIGTLQTVEKQDYKGFWNYLNKIENNILNVDISLRNKIDDELSKMAQFTKQAEIMSRKFDIVCTNPPYLNKFGGQLKDFVIRNYKEYSGDLFSVFIYRNFNYCKIGGYSAFMTPFVWMFIKTHESLRRFIIESKEITTLVQMEYSAFEEATVPICSFILKNSNNEKKGLYFRLSDFKGGMEVQKQKVLDAISDKDCGYYYETDQSNFPKIPGSPIAYWASDTTLEIYSEKLLSETVDCKSGIMTGSDTFIKLWYEPSIKRIKFNCNKYEDMGNFKWFPLNSGGEYRKWSGNNFKVVNLWSNGKEIRENVQNYRLRDSRFYFKKGITWGRITSSKIAFRDVIKGSLFGDAGPIGFVDEEKEYVLGFLCSKVVKVLLQITNPTLNFQVRDIMNLPLVKDSKYYNNVKKMVLECVKFSKNDWDSFEISWDFKKHPLLCYSSDTISSAFDSWSQECDNRFNQLKANEEELNRIFIDIYGLQDELTP